MNKKSYTAPTSKVCKIETHRIICYSIQGVLGGDTDITYGGDESGVVEGDARRGSLWDDED